MHKATPLIYAGALVAATAWLTFPALGAPATAEAPAASPAPSWPHQQSDIKPDAKAVFGTLPNGLRYIIFPNSEPPKRVSLRLHIAAGSLMEADDQQGLAHFMEHMVFNGTKHYKEDELIPLMQRKGIAFGAHANAYTSFDETVYMLDLPDIAADTLDLGFGVMRDQADGALLKPEEIDKERGVILSEKTSRDSVSYRLMEQQFEQILPGSLVSRRFPIGKADVIAKAPRERFLDFYSRYYVPERMTFVVVGDVDPQAMARRIEAAFSSMKSPQNPGKDPQLGEVRRGNGLQCAVFTDKEVRSTELSLTTVKDFVKKPDTSAQRISDLPLACANAMLSRRFERLAKKENSPIVSGSASHYELFNYAALDSVDVTATDDRWQDALPVLEQELRRAVQFGFTPSELEEIKANLLSSAEQAAKSADSRKSDDLATAIAKSINDGEVLSSPATDLEITKQGLATLTAEACHAALKETWSDAPVHLILTTKEAAADTKDILTKLHEESRSKPVEADANREAAAFGYESFGATGSIAKQTEVADFAISQWVLSNNVRVNFKRTDFEKNTIRLSARIGNGKLTQPKDKPGIDLFTTSVFEAGGLGKHSIDDLQQITAGRNVSTTLTIDTDAFVLSGKTTPQDLALQLRLMCAQLTDAGYRPEALRQFRMALPMIDQQLKHTPAGAMKNFQAWLHGDDPRFSMPATDVLAKYTMDDAKAWLNPELANGVMELSIVGDFDPAVLGKELLATFGALPPRLAAKPDLDQARTVNFPAPTNKTYTYETKIPQGVSIVVWKTQGLRERTREGRRLNLLAEIYQDRLREEIREKLGASYSPNAGASGDDALKGFGFLMGQSVGKPEDVEKLGTLMREIADKLAQEGANEDELERARKPLLSQLDATLRDNGYWLGTVLGQCQEDPDRIALARERMEDYQSITLREINAKAAEYFKAGNASIIAIKPR